MIKLCKPFPFAIIVAIVAANAHCASFTAEVSGTGKPVILIPGLGCSAEVWRETAAHLNKEGYQTHALTLAGFGGTKAIAGDHFLDTVREDLATYIRDKKLDHPVIIGHSLGGFLALWLSETNPDLPGRVISVDGLPFLTAIMNPAIEPEGVMAVAAATRKQFTSASDEQFKQMQRQSIESMVSSPENIEREMKVTAIADRAAFTEATLEMTVTDLRPELKSIKAPVLVLGAWIVYKEYGASHNSATQLYAAQFPNFPAVKLVMSDTAKHFIQLDAPDWFYNQVDQFIEAK
jgi:pimeloyl-ACP methyl ester carboxylesterase